MPTRHQVFLSYAHADGARWRDDFRVMLEPAVKRGSISLWTDGDIPVGQNWRQNIDRALACTSAGLLLVTPHFWDSSFITDVELERLLVQAATRGVNIQWVPVSRTLYKQTALEPIQAAWDPEQPLDELSDAERRAAVYRICDRLVQEFGFLPKVTTERRRSLPQIVQARLGDKYEIGDELGTGNFSIVYKAEQKHPSRTVAVKVLLASEFDDSARLKFKAAAERAASLVSPAFIKIIESLMDDQPEILITEFVPSEPLSKFLLRYPHGIRLGTVKAILSDLGRAIGELHAQGWVRGEICSSNILMEPTGAARLSATDFSTVLIDDSQMVGNFLVDRESLAYMTPERFFGHPRSRSSDQYTLGLIAMELLGGERVPVVSSPSDLADKRRLFADLEAGRGKWAQRSPEFAGIVRKLLKIDPLERFSSMSDVGEYLQDIEVAESDEEISRRVARAGYWRLQGSGAERAVFEQFYANLVAACPEIKAHFDKIDMEQQYKMLNNAIRLLLDFDPQCGCPQLRDLAAAHSPLGLTRRHYSVFLEGLLHAIEQSGVGPEHVAAWRQILTPGINFMCTCEGLRSADASGPPVGV